MIRVITEKGNITVAPNTKLNFVFKNSILQADFSARSFSFAIDAPVDKVTAKTLEQLHIVEATNRVTDIPAIIEWRTAQFAKGIMKLRSFTQTMIRFNIDCNDNEVTFSTDNVATVVNEVFTFANVDAMLAQFKADVNKQWPDVKYSLPMLHNKDFYGAANSQFSQGHDWYFLNQTDGNNPPEFKKNFYNPGDGIPKNYYTMVPFFYIKYIFKTIVENMGYNIGGDWWNDSLYDSAMLYNNFPLDKLTNATYNYGSFLSVKSAADFNVPLDVDFPIQEFRANLETEISDPLAYYDKDEFVVQLNRTGDYTFTYDIDYIFAFGTASPFSNKKYQCKVWLELDNGETTTIVANSVSDFKATFSSSDPVASLRNHTKTVTINVDETMVGSSLYLKVLFRNEAAIVYRTSEPYTNLGKIKANSTLVGSIANTQFDLNSYTNIIDVAKHMPDMSIREFVKEFCKQFGIYYVLDKSSNTLKFNYLKNWINDSDEEDWTHKVQRGYTGDYEPVKTRGWKYDFGADSFPKTSGYESKKWFNLDYDSAETKILFKFPPIIQSQQTYNEYFDLIVTPRIEGEVSASPLFGIGGSKNTAPPRILFYWGMQRYSNIHIDSYYYNYASGDYSRRPDPKGYIGTALVNSSGSNSKELLLKRCHVDWNEFVDGLEPFEFDVDLSINDLSKLPETMKKKIRIQNSLYVIDEIQFVAGDTIETAIAKLKKI